LLYGNAVAASPLVSGSAKRPIVTKINVTHKVFTVAVVPGVVSGIRRRTDAWKNFLGLLRGRTKGRTTGVISRSLRPSGYPRGLDVAR